MAQTGPGRPTDFTKELADEILERMTDGESLRSICIDKRMPGRSTVFRWLQANSEFRELYTFAREAQADAFVDEIVHIADTPITAEVVTEKTVTLGSGKEAKLQPVTEKRIGDAVERSKLMVDARKWAASKQAPKKYGERIDVNTSIRHEDAIDELDRLEKAARNGAASQAEE